MDVFDVSSTPAAVTTSLNRARTRAHVFARAVRLSRLLKFHNYVTLGQVGKHEGQWHRGLYATLGLLLEQGPLVIPVALPMALSIVAFAMVSLLGRWASMAGL